MRKLKSVAVKITLYRLHGLQSEFTPKLSKKIMFLSQWFIVIFPPLAKKKIEKPEKESKGKYILRHVYQISDKSTRIKNI